MTTVLDSRALNRALLQRQMLLRPGKLKPAAAIERLVALQAQSPSDPYFGLWQRIEGFRTEDLSTLIRSRRAVRIALLRATIHLATSRDALAMRPLLQPVLERVFSQSSPFGRRLSGLDLGPVLRRGRKLLEDRPLSNAELEPLLHERWPDWDAEALAQAVRYILPLVQVPPRGLWGESGQARHTTLDHWLGRPLAEPLALGRLLMRYLAAFGPATAADARAWSGLTGLREGLERLRPKLRTFRDERGRELFDVPDGALPPAETPAPVRFLPVYDNAVLAHADRARIVPPAQRPALVVAEGVSIGSILIDGFVRAFWRIETAERQSVLRVRLVDEVSRRERGDLVAEGRRLLAFAVPTTRAGKVQVE